MKSALTPRADICFRKLKWIISLSYGSNLRRMSGTSKITQTLASFSIMVVAVGPQNQATAQEVQSMSELSLHRYVLEDGDGDPDWLHERHIVEHISRDGFRGLVGEWYGEALLFRVIGPNHKGEIIALTPRTVGEISEQLSKNEIASVIVHRFQCGEKALRDGEACNSSAIGMSVLRKSDQEANLD